MLTRISIQRRVIFFDALADSGYISPPGEATFAHGIGCD